MDDLTRILWEYAAAYRLETCYSKDDKDNRTAAEQMAGKAMEKLQKTCSAENLDRLDALWSGLEEVRSEDMEAAFACGLSVGLSLSRLG